MKHPLRVLLPHGIPFIVVLTLAILTGCGGDESPEGPTETAVATPTPEKVTEGVEPVAPPLPATPTPEAATSARTSIENASGTIIVHVTSFAGAPIDDATVTWGPDAPKTEVSSMPTDASGGVEIGPLAPGHYLVRAVGKAFVPEERRNVELPPGETLRLTIRLYPATTITGTVLENVTGKPVAEAAIIARWQSPAGKERECPAPKGNVVKAKTNKDGIFSLAPLCRSEPYTLTASHPEYISAELGIEEAGGQKITFTLDPAGWISGGVVSPAGEPIGDASVSLVVPTGSRGPDGLHHLYGLGSQTISDSSDGTFRFPGLDTGEHFIKAWKGDLVTRHDPDPRGVEAIRGKGTDGVEVVLVPGGTLRAKAIDKDTGEPVSGLGIEIRNKRYMGKTGIPQRSGKTDENGVLVVRGLDRGKNRIELQTIAYRFPGEEGPEFEVAPGETLEREIVLTRTSRIAGRVLDPPGNPVARAEIRALKSDWRRLGSSRAEASQGLETNPDGYFEIQDCQPWLR